ncbi:MAG TPA: hypothetical protein DD670_05590 [Planctomycetaceae bacterium]|nr:hypothetical protein [Planctomycetaceae bacterium]
MDSFQTCLAFGPPAVYLLGVAAVNLRRRPTVVSGTRDLALLAFAMAGLVAVGPMELGFPESAALNFLGPLVWIPLFSLYGLCVVLAILTVRPRLVVYNITADQLRQLLAEVVESLDAEARWAGDSLFLPRLGVQLHLDASRAMRNISLVAAGPNQSFLGWQKLQRHLAASAASVRVARNGWALGFALVALGMIGGMIFLVAQDPDATIAAMHEMFRV